MRKSSFVLLLFSALLLCMAHASGADAACGNPHCYGYVVWYPSGTYTGALANVTTTRLGGVAGSDFEEVEFWVRTDQTPAVAWLETGQTRGPINGIWYDNALFWAEQNTAGSYAEHVIQGAALGTGYAMKVSYSGGGRWSTYVAGNRVGESSANHAASIVRIAGGVEITTSNAVISGTLTALQKRGADNVTWSYNWPSTQFNNDPPTSAAWTTQYTAFAASAN